MKSFYISFSHFLIKAKIGKIGKGYIFESLHTKSLPNVKSPFSKQGLGKDGFNLAKFVQIGVSQFKVVGNLAKISKVYIESLVQIGHCHVYCKVRRL